MANKLGGVSIFLIKVTSPSPSPSLNIRIMSRDLVILISKSCYSLVVLSGAHICWFAYLELIKFRKGLNRFNVILLLLSIFQFISFVNFSTETYLISESGNIDYNSAAETEMSQVKTSTIIAVIALAGKLSCYSKYIYIRSMVTLADKPKWVTSVLRFGIVWIDICLAFGTVCTFLGFFSDLDDDLKSKLESKWGFGLAALAIIAMDVYFIKIFYLIMFPPKAKATFTATTTLQTSFDTSSKKDTPFSRQCMLIATYGLSSIFLSILAFVFNILVRFIFQASLVAVFLDIGIELSLWGVLITLTVMKYKLNLLRGTEGPKAQGTPKKINKKPISESAENSGVEG